MRILSTPSGQQGKFYDLAKTLGLDTGMRPAAQPVRVGAGDQGPGAGGNKSPVPDPRRLNPWSGHWCDIFMAVEDGLPLDVEEVRGGCDEETWLQEYCCQFVSEASEWISPELFQQCVSSDASSEWRMANIENPAGDSLYAAPLLYAGWDVARNRDLSVIWINELVGDVAWTRGVVEMKNTPTPDQIREARSLMPLLNRMVIDKGGMGLVIFEALEREFPSQVEGIQFSQPKKETMAVLAKRAMEEHKVRLPDSNAIRQSFRSVKKSVNALGLTRFDAEHDSHFGHADHWWAFCLAQAASERPTATYHLAEVGKLVGKPVISGAREWAF